MPECEYCGKTIKKFTVKNDWSGRKYHRVCIQKIMNFEYALELVRKYKTTN
jgi:hypothetical protein